MLDFVSADEPQAKGANLNQFVDAGGVREVQASGFIEAVYENEHR